MDSYMPSGHQRSVPAEFWGKGRKLIDAIGEEDAKLDGLVRQASLPVKAQRRPRKSVTERFILRLHEIQGALPLGAFPKAPISLSHPTPGKMEAGICIASAAIIRYCTHGVVQFCRALIGGQAPLTL